MVAIQEVDFKPLTAANEALMFSIYYATITSMEDEDVRLSSAQSYPHCQGLGLLLMHFHMYD